MNFSVNLLAQRFSDNEEVKTEQVFLLDQHAKFISHPDPSLIGTKATPAILARLSGSPGQLVKLNQTEFYLTYHPVEHFGWNFVSIIPRKMVENEIAPIGNTGLIVFLLALSIATTLAAYFSRKVVTPIRHVTGAFKQLNQGEMDIVKLPVKGNDEVSQLAQWFNSYLDELTRHKAAEKALRISEERYQLVINATEEGIWDFNLESNEIFYSDRMKEIVGLPNAPVNLSLPKLFKLIYQEDRKRLRRQFYRFMRSHDNALTVEFRVMHSDGEVIFLRSNSQAIRDENGKVLRLVGSVQDISPQKQIEYRLRHDASHDPLTGLYNRSWMLKRIERELTSEKSGHDKPCAVLFIDLDNFKTLNDTLGHSYGDLLLVETATRIAECLRPGDSLARLGGDEFIVLLTDISSLDAVGVVERVVKKIANPYKLRDQEYRTHASIGVAFSKTRYQNAEEILRDADTAMYQAKFSGKGQYVIFDHQMRKSLLYKTALERELENAIVKGQLEMHYQPIQNLATRAISGFEALVRWKHPSRDISPTEFINVAEESGLIHKLGDWIIAQVLSDLAQWQQKFSLADDFKLTINISPKQLSDSKFIDHLTEQISDLNLNPKNLAIELTETAIFRDKNRVLEYLNQLQAIDVSVYLDDFGTGFSSLSYLNNFPIDAIKIDKSFILKLAPGNREARLVNTLILLGKELDIKVIAEGVENEELIAYLTERSCGYAQGFFISRPVAFTQATQLLTQQLSKS